jgi:chromate reductase
MITVIAGTNRNDSMTLRVAQVYHKLISEHTEHVHLLSLQGINVWERNEQLSEVEEKWLVPAEKFVFVMPEYNGSIPGILKLMMDNSDIRRCWWYKKALLAGVSDGRAGNLRGLDHMTNILNYLRVQVFYNKIPISRINEEIDLAGNLLKETTAAAIAAQVEAFLKF